MPPKAQMGVFAVPIRAIGPTGITADVDALVDTGATYLVLPANTLRALGVAAVEKRQFRLADTRTLEYDVGVVQIELEGRRLPVLAVFGDDNARPLLGATVLELFGLAVDPVEQRLFPVPGWLT
jgi:clan AA aspartic protease